MTNYELQKLRLIMRLLRHAHTALMQHYEHLLEEATDNAATELPAND